MLPVRSLRRFATALSTVLTLAVGALPGPARAQVASVDNSGSALTFFPIIAFERLILTVTGPCDFRFEQAVTSGEPTFTLGATTIDGRYTYPRS